MQTTIEISSWNQGNIDKGLLHLSVDGTTRAIEAITSLEMCANICATRTQCTDIKVDYHHKKEYIGSVYECDGLLVVAPKPKTRYKRAFRYYIAKFLTDMHCGIIVNTDVTILSLEKEATPDIIEMVHS